MQSNTFPLSSGEAIGLIPDPIGNTGSSEVVHQSGSSQRRDIGIGAAGFSRCGFRELGHASRVTERVRRLQVGEISEGPSSIVDARLGQPRTRFRLELKNRVPHGFLFNGPEHLIGPFEECLSHFWIVLPSSTTTNHLANFFPTLIHTVDRDVMSKAADPRRQVDVLAGDRARYAFAIPAFMHLREGLAD